VNAGPVSPQAGPVAPPEAMTRIPVPRAPEGPQPASEPDVRGTFEKALAALDANPGSLAVLPEFREYQQTRDAWLRREPELS
jgi:hypothetical protein